MTMNLGKKIISVKDIPSNLIEEAIFILKSDVIESKDTAIKKEIILSEAEDIVNEYEMRVQVEKDIERQNKQNKIEQMKHEAIYLAVLFVFASIVISLLI